MKNEKRLILIVDDFKDTRDMYCYFLSQNGYRVAVADDGEGALDSALKLQPDLVIMDLSLPGINGWEATRRLKAGERTKHIPIVILTAHALDGAATVIQAGCDGFLIKPCLPQDMLKEVVRVLERSCSSSTRE